MGVKISNLPNNALPYSGSELIPMVQSGETRAGSLSSFASLLSGVLLADTELAQLSGVWQSTYTTTQANSANWSSVYNSVNSLSATWEESAEILPTVTNYLSSNNVLLSSVTITDTIKDNTGLSTINTNNRQLIAANGSTALLDWSNNGGYGVEFPSGADMGANSLWFPDGGSYHSIQGGKLYDGTNTPSIDWATRQLIGSDGSTTAATWTDGYLALLDLQIAGLIKDQATANSIDLSLRQLIASDGSTVMLDWNSTTGIDAYAINTASGYTTQGGAAQFTSGFDAGSSSGIVGSLLTGVDFTESIDVDGRQLIGSDGSTVMLDWSSGMPDFPSGLTAVGIDGGAYNVSATDGDFDTLSDYSNSGPPSLPYGAAFSPTVVASLTGPEGTMAYVNDADTPVIGSAVVGGASAKCLVCYNGTDWIVTSLL